MVIGAGMAGLLAARVLADLYRHVTVLDRDRLPEDAVARGGVPQGRHVHALLFSGLEIIDELFPGLKDDLVAIGVPTGDVLADSRSYFGGYRLLQAPSGLPSLSVSRPVLEHSIRVRVATLPTVTIVSDCAVTGLRLSRDRARVCGVYLDARDEGPQHALVDADLVVDASGRTSQTPRWLATLGYPTPREERVAVNVGYSSCLVALPRAAISDGIAITIGGTVTIPRGGAIVRAERDQWLVSMAGYQGAHPPVELNKYLDYAKSLVVPDIYDVLRHATPLVRPVRFRVPHTTRRHYESLRRFPAGLLVIGDAACHFNPVYGQGMSVAARQCLILREGLSQPTPSLPRIRRGIAKAAAVAWTMSTTGDLKMPQVAGRRTRLTRLGNHYSDLMFRAAERDPVVARKFMRVANLVESPARLVHPDVLRRVFLGGRSADAVAGPVTIEPSSFADMSEMWHDEHIRAHDPRAEGQ